MILTLSTPEMLSQWRLRRQLEPLRSDCTVLRSDGIDLERLLTAEMRDWYLTLLDTAPLEMLAVTDIAGETALQVNGSDNCHATVLLPERCRRVVSVMLGNWQRPAVVTAPGSVLARCQDSPYSRASAHSPVAVLEPGQLRLYGGIDPFSPPEIASLKCVLVPPDGYYVLDERALSLIPTPSGTDCL